MRPPDRGGTLKEEEGVSPAAVAARGAAPTDRLRDARTTSHSAWGLGVMVVGGGGAYTEGKGRIMEKRGSKGVVSGQKGGEGEEEARKDIKARRAANTRASSAPRYQPKSGSSSPTAAGPAAARAIAAARAAFLYTM